jgi:hypothetical protein
MLSTDRGGEFEKDGSATDSVSVTLPRVGRGASDTDESPWRQLRERAEKIPGDKEHDPGLRGFSMAIRTGVDHMRTAYFDSSLAIRGQDNIRTTATLVYYLFWYFGRPSVHMAMRSTDDSVRRH